MADDASVNAGNGKPKRNGKPVGRPFKKGNPGGPGNPWAKASHSLKSAIIAISESASDKDGCRSKMDELAKMLWDLALSEKTGPDRRFALAELSNRIAGKPKEIVEIEDKRADAGDPFDLLSEPEVRIALDRAFARRAGNKVV